MDVEGAARRRARRGRPGREKAAEETIRRVPDTPSRVPLAGVEEGSHHGVIPAGTDPASAGAEEGRRGGGVVAGLRLASSELGVVGGASPGTTTRDAGGGGHCGSEHRAPRSRAKREEAKVARIRLGTWLERRAAAKEGRAAARRRRRGEARRRRLLTTLADARARVAERGRMGEGEREAEEESGGSCRLGLGE